MIPAVRAVLGPGTIARSAARLRSAGRRAVAAQRGLPRRTGSRLKSLGKNVSSAADGVDSLRSSLSSANAATARIEAGSQDLEGGVGTLRKGLSGAGSGARDLAGKLADAGRGADGLVSQSAAAGGGARKLRDGARQLSSGLTTLAGSLRDLQSRLRGRIDTLNRVQSEVRAQRRKAEDILSAAERSISPTTTAGIQARAALALARRALAVDAGAGLDEPLRQLGLDAEYAAKIATALPTADAARLASAIGDLAVSADAIAKRVRNLGGTVGSLADGGDSLVAALQELDGGADQIGKAVGAVGASIDGLASGVRSGEKSSNALASGLQDASSAVRGLSGSPASAKDAQPQKASASFFDSGYFLLAALESGNGDAPFGVNVEKGGQGARIVVVPRYPAADPRTHALYERLRTASDQLAKTLGADAAVGGPAAVLSDYDAAATNRLPLIVLVLTLVTALLLAILLRSIVVAFIGVVLNLLAVGATLGLLRLLFQGDAPLLGGPGEIDAVAVTAIFGVVFALSIDYQVFIVSRVREEWLRGGDSRRAVQVGLARTARVVTGAALSMLGVFLAFGLADVASLRQFGVGLAIAVIIDATLVRLVLLPAALHLAGDWAWWTPRLFSVEDSGRPRARCGARGAGRVRASATYAATYDASATLRGEPDLRARRRRVPRHARPRVRATVAVDADDGVGRDGLDGRRLAGQSGSGLSRSRRHAVQARLPQAAGRARRRGQQPAAIDRVLELAADREAEREAGAHAVGVAVDSIRAHVDVRTLRASPGRALGSRQPLVGSSRKRAHVAATAGSSRSSRAASSQRRPALRVDGKRALPSVRARPGGSIAPAASVPLVGQRQLARTVLAVERQRERRRMIGAAERPAERGRDGAPARARRGERQRRGAGARSRRAPIIAPEQSVQRRSGQRAADPDPAERAHAALDEDLGRRRLRPAGGADRPHERVGLALVAGDEHLARAEHALCAGAQAVGHAEPPTLHRDLQAAAEADLDARAGAARDGQPDGPVGHQLAQHVAILVGADEHEVDGDVARVAHASRRRTDAGADRRTARRRRCTARSGSDRRRR